MTHTVTTQPVDVAPEEQQALDQVMSTAAAIEAEWSRGTREVEELERRAERIRDVVRERTEILERRQAEAVLALYRTRSVEDLAQVLGTTLDDTLRAVREAEARVEPRIPGQRTG